VTWRDVHIPRKTILKGLNDSFCELQDRRGDCFGDYSMGRTLVIGSDYSGEARSASYYSEQ
jgi:hypothetical protein